MIFFHSKYEICRDGSNWFWYINHWTCGWQSYINLRSSSESNGRDNVELFCLTEILKVYSRNFSEQHSWATFEQHHLKFLSSYFLSNRVVWSLARRGVEDKKKVHNESVSSKATSNSANHSQSQSGWWKYKDIGGKHKASFQR